MVPGLLLAWAVRLRGWAALGTAPLFTFALLVVAVLVASRLDLRWTPLTAGWIAALQIVVAALAALPGRRVSRHRATAAPADAEPADGDGRLWSWLAGLGVAAGTVVGFVTVVTGTGHLRLPNQGFDALFHVNLVELIGRTGDVDPGISATLNGYAPGASVYPDAFHAVASLVAQLHGTSITAINGLLACIPLLAGLGLVALLRAMGLVRAAVAAPVALAATTGYPYDLMWRGPVWVYVFGITLVPGFLVALRWALDRRGVLPTVVLGVAASGLALVHPSAALSAALFGLFWVISRWWGARGRVPRDLLVLVVAAVLAAVLAWPLIGKALVDSGGGTIVDWPAVQTPGQALGELALYDYDSKHSQFWLALPALVGLVAGWRHRPLRWWYGGTAASAVLCLLAAAYDNGLVQLLTGPWWNDRFRLMGLAFLGLAVFAAVGLVVLADRLGAVAGGLVGRRRPLGPAGRRHLAVGAVLLVLVCLGGVTGGYYTGHNEARFRIAYVPAGGLTVGPADERAFAELRRLAGSGPVLNDPNDGSAWMWALADVRPVFGAAVTVPVSPPLPHARQVVLDGLNCLDSDAEVRRAVAELGVRYVYSSNTTIVGPPTPNLGFRDLGQVRSLQQVYSEGGATIYRIDLAPLGQAADSSCQSG